MTPLRTLLLIALAVLAAAAGARAGAARRCRAWERIGQFTDSHPRAGRALAAAVLTAAALGYALFLSRMAIAQHHGLGTHTADLGYYDNILHQSSHGHFLGCSFFPSELHSDAHFDPILVVLSPLHRLHPRAETLLVAQSFWLASGVVPLYLLSRRVLAGTPSNKPASSPSPSPHAGGGRASAALVALAYLFHPALAGANAYDFHSLTLVVVPLLWLAWAFEAQAKGPFCVALLVALLCREDVALLLCFAGVAMARARRPGAARFGWITLGVSVLWFAVVRGFVMRAPDATDAGKLVKTFAHYYEELLPTGGGPVQLAWNVVTHPLLALDVVFREPKAVFFLQLFLPLAFLPFVVKKGRLALAYGLALCLLASRPALFDIYHQYPCTILPVAFALVPYALRRARDRGLFPAALAALGTGTLLVGLAFGIFLPTATFRSGAFPLVRSLSPEQEGTYAWVEEQTARIPETASVGASQTLGPHVSSRMRAYFYPDRLDVDWVFIDEAETVGEGLAAHHRAVRTGTLVEIARHGTLVLFQRNPPTSPLSSGPRDRP